MPQNNLNDIILAAVEDGLSSLGDSPKQAIIFHLETSFHIKKECIPENLTEFTKALEGIFGPGASYLEKLILKHLYGKLGLKFEEKSWNFQEYIDNVKKQLLQENV